MVLFPPCKINLGLHVVRKRTDGYHDLETCFYPLPLTDILEIIPAETLRFTSSGNPIPGNAEDNLCLKAYLLLNEDFTIPRVHIHLHKVIPTGAGLGGGSADGAYALRMLNTLFELQLTREQLVAYASKLGSDCAFFIYDKPMIGTGRGEVLLTSDVSLKGKYLVLIKPDVHVSTAEAYAGVTPKQPERPLQDVVESKDVGEWCTVLRNDFEASVFNTYPVIKEIKERLYHNGALYASMSGSGSAVFGVFDHAVEVTDDVLLKHLVWKGQLLL